MSEKTQNIDHCTEKISFGMSSSPRSSLLRGVSPTIRHQLPASTKCVSASDSLRVGNSSKVDPKNEFGLDLISPLNSERESSQMEGFGDRIVVNRVASDVPLTGSFNHAQRSHLTIGSAQLCSGLAEGHVAAQTPIAASQVSVGEEAGHCNTSSQTDIDSSLEPIGRIFVDDCAVGSSKINSHFVQRLVPSPNLAHPRHQTSSLLFSQHASSSAGDPAHSSGDSAPQSTLFGHQPHLQRETSNPNNYLLNYSSITPAAAMAHGISKMQPPTDSRTLNHFQPRFRNGERTFGAVSNSNTTMAAGQEATASTLHGNCFTPEMPTPGLLTPYQAFSAPYMPFNAAASSGSFERASATDIDTIPQSQLNSQVFQPPFLLYSGADEVSQANTVLPANQQPTNHSYQPMIHPWPSQPQQQSQLLNPSHYAAHSLSALASGMTSQDSFHAHWQPQVHPSHQTMQSPSGGLYALPVPQRHPLPLHGTGPPQRVPIQEAVGHSSSNSSHCNTSSSRSQQQWTTDDDKRLLQLVQRYGRRWQQLQQIWGDTRTCQQLRNRYVTIQRRYARQQARQQARAASQQALKDNLGEAQLTDRALACGNVVDCGPHSQPMSSAQQITSEKRTSEALQSPSTASTNDVSWSRAQFSPLKRSRLC